MTDQQSSTLEPRDGAGGSDFSAWGKGCEYQRHDAATLAGGQQGDAVSGRGWERLHPPTVRSYAVVKPQEGATELPTMDEGAQHREQK